MLTVTEVTIPHTYSRKEFIKGIYKDDFFIEDFFNEHMIEEFLEELALSRYLSWKTRKDSLWRSKFCLFWSGELPDLHIFTKGSPKPFKRGEVRVTVKQEGFKCTLYKYNKEIKDGIYKIAGVFPTRLNNIPLRDLNPSKWKYFFEQHSNIDIKFNPEPNGSISEINIEGLKLSSFEPDNYVLSDRYNWFSISGEIPKRELPTLLNVQFLSQYALEHMKKSK